MNRFNNDNTDGYTDGYTDAELDALNAEWELITANLEPDSDDYYQAAHSFDDAVARR